MIEINIPGRGLVQLEHLVSDVNGTLAVDGELIPGVKEHLDSLKGKLDIHLLTADTHGQQNIIDQKLELEAVRVKPGNEAQQKAEYVHGLGADRVISFGQGANDASMLDVSAIGVCVLSAEGAAISTLEAADIVVSDIITAFQMLEKPTRMIATLRK
jgi:P-type E1-E2 ATPase